MQNQNLSFLYYLQNQSIKYTVMQRMCYTKNNNE